MLRSKIGTTTKYLIKAVTETEIANDPDTDSQRKHSRIH